MLRAVIPFLPIPDPLLKKSPPSFILKNMMVLGFSFHRAVLRYGSEMLLRDL